MENKNSLKRFLRNIYGYGFFNKMTLLTPVYALFMQANGVTDAQLSGLMMLYPIAILLTQMPVTKITNRIGRKYAVVIGQMLKALAFVIWCVVPTLSGFALGMFLWGMQFVFSEIAMDALIYDELDARHGRGAYTRVLGRYFVAKASGVAVSAFGSLAMVWGYGWVTVASVVALGLSVLCVLNIRQMAPAIVIPKKVRFTSLIRVGCHLCMTVPCILNLMLLSLMVANFAYLDDYLGPIGVAIGLPMNYVGIMPFLLLGCSVLGQRIAYKFARISNYTIYGAICAVGALFGMFCAVYSVAAIALLCAAYFLVGVLNTLLYSKFQDAIPTHARSVLLSFYSIGSNAAYVMVCGVIGLGSGLGSWRWGVAMLGAVLVWTGVWGAMFVRNQCAVHNADVRAANTAPKIGTNSVA